MFWKRKKKNSEFREKISNDKIIEIIREYELLSLQELYYEELRLKHEIDYCSIEVKSPVNMSLVMTILASGIISLGTSILCTNFNNNIYGADLIFIILVFTVYKLFSDHYKDLWNPIKSDISKNKLRLNILLDIKDKKKFNMSNGVER